MRSVRFNTLRNRLVLLSLAITAFTVGFTYAYVAPQLESNLTQNRLDRLRERAAQQSEELGLALTGNASQAQLDATVDRSARIGDSDIAIVKLHSADPQTPQPPRVISSSTASANQVPSGWSLDASSGATTTRIEMKDGVRYVSIAVPIPSTTPAWVIEYTQSLDDIDDTVALVKEKILIAGLIAIAIALGVGYYAARSISRRVERLETAALKVAAGDFANPIQVDSSDEIGELAKTFNEMQRRLGDLERARRQFIANASHELRTPIFSLSGFIELLDTDDPDPAERAEFIRTMREQSDRLIKLTADLLDLSRLDAGAMEIQPGPVNLATITRDLAREFGPTADQRGSRLEVRTPDQAPIALADQERVRQIIRILLDNALSHTPEGTKVTMTSYQQKTRPEITVSDEGPGIPGRVRTKMFDRFFTGESAKGSGLGLSIASELAHRMDGHITATTEKGFTAFTLDLPPAGELDENGRVEA